VENVKLRFSSITTVWFAQKEPKSLTKDTFYRLECISVEFAAGAVPQTPLGELTALPQTRATANFSSVGVLSKKVLTKEF